MSSNVSPKNAQLNLGVVPAQTATDIGAPAPTAKARVNGSSFEQVLAQSSPKRPENLDAPRRTETPKQAAVRPGQNVSQKSAPQRPAAKPAAPTKSAGAPVTREVDDSVNPTQNSDVQSSSERPESNAPPASAKKDGQSSAQAERSVSRPAIITKSKDPASSEVTVSEQELLQLKDIFLKNGEPAIGTPVLALLSGKPQLLEPGQIPDLVATNPFIADAFSQTDSGKIVDLPQQLGEFIQDLDPARNVLEEIKRTGIDLSQMVTPRQFFDALGIDPNRVSIELKALKSNIQMVDGLTSYMIRAAKIRGQNGENSSDGTIQSVALDSETTKIPSGPGGLSSARRPVQFSSLTGSSGVADRPEVPATDAPVDFGVNAAAPVNERTGNVAGFQPNSTEQTRRVSDPEAPKTKIPAVTTGDDFRPIVEPKPVETTLAGAAPMAKVVRQSPFEQLHLGLNVQRMHFDQVEPSVTEAEVEVEMEVEAESASNELVFEQGKVRVISENNITAPITVPMLERISTEPGMVPKMAADKLEDDAIHTDSEAKPAPIGHEYQQPENLFALDANTTLSKTESKTEPASKAIELGQLIERLTSSGFSAGKSSAQGESNFDQSGRKSDAEIQLPVSIERQSIGEKFSVESKASPKVDSGPATDTMIRKVMEKAEMLVNDGGGSVRVEVETADFGKVEVAVKVEGEKLELKLLTNTEGARDLVNQGLTKLRDQLSQQNLHLARVDVGLSTQLNWSQGQSGQMQFEQQQQRSLSNSNGVGRQSINNVIPMHQRVRYQTNPHHIGSIQIAV